MTHMIRRILSLFGFFKKKTAYSVVLYDHTLTYEYPNGSIRHLSVLEIKQVFAYKDDVVAYDIICVGLRVNDSGEAFRVEDPVKQLRY